MRFYMNEIYNKFYREKINKSGEIENIEIDVKNDFNFAYDVLDVLAQKCTNKTALIYRGIDGRVKRFSFGEMSEYSKAFAKVLVNDGIGKGDVVMLIMKRRYEFWIALMALHRIGAIAVPTSHMVTDKDIDERVDRAGVKAVIAVAANEVIQCINIGCKGKPIKKYVVGKKMCGYDFIMDRVNKVVKTQNVKEDVCRVQTSVNDPMLYYFTSGTTGKPKIVIHDFSYPLAHIMTAKNWQGAFSGGVHLTVADSGWAKFIWGKVYGQWFLETTVVSYDYEQFYAKEMLELLEKLKVTSFCAPPTIYKYLVKEKIEEYDLSLLKNVTTAGEHLPAVIAKQFLEKTSLYIREGFGQTETSFLIGKMIGDKADFECMGRKNPMYNLRVVDENGNEVNPGEEGELVVVPSEKNEKILGIFSGYLDGENSYREVWENGVYHTRDLVKVNENGLFTYCGRNDDVIKSSGYRIGPSEVEEVLNSYPCVKECAVTGMPHKQRGEIVKASIVLEDNVKPSTELKRKLQNFVKKNIAIYKYPRVIEFVDYLPKNSNGKICRRAIKRRDVTG